MYNQHTRGMATTRHRSLVERGGRKALLETLHTNTKKKMSEKTDIHESKENVRAHRASSKATFLQSNKSNINQCVLVLFLIFNSKQG